MACRYAIYYAPEPDTTLWQLASDWLGRDATNDMPRPQPLVQGLSGQEIVDFTARPRRYGFHATLKPPFTLRDGMTEAGLRDALYEFASRHRAFNVRLDVNRIGGFLALTPRVPRQELDTLAADCVKAFEPFRAPLSREEMARHLRAGLNLRQRALLNRWGYPYVMEEFRFHMTLTATLSVADRQHTLPRLQEMLEPALGVPLAIDAVTLFMQADKNSDFVISERFRFRHSFRRQQSRRFTP